MPLFLVVCFPFMFSLFYFGSISFSCIMRGSVSNIVGERGQS
jgi:hypothetical protein